MESKYMSQANHVSKQHVDGAEQTQSAVGALVVEVQCSSSGHRPTTVQPVVEIDPILCGQCVIQVHT